MANQNSSSFPGLISLVECDEGGVIIQSEGDDAETLGNVTVYFHQMAALIGDSFGLEGMEEGRMFGKNMTAVCLPRDHSTLGALFESKAKIDNVLSTLMSGNG